MTDVLKLQTLPENVQAFAKRIMQDGSCISLVSISAEQAHKTSSFVEAGKDLADSCVSLVSISG